MTTTAMTEADRPTSPHPTIGRSYSDQVVPEGEEIRDANYSQRDISSFGAKGVRFYRCNFNYSIISHGYFRKAKFFECQFIGCRFDGCNFREAEFDKCNFSYSTFDRTLVAAEDLRIQTPAFPNLRTEIARNLRINAESMGDAESARQCFKFEMEQHEIYLREGKSGQEQYYKKKYPGLRNRARFAIKLYAHQGSALIWGHGESPSLILRFASVAWIVLAMIWAWSLAPAKAIQEISFGEFGEFGGQAVWHALVIMLGSVPGNLPDSGWTKALIAINSLVGHIAFGLLIVAMVKRYAKR